MEICTWWMIGWQTNFFSIVISDGNECSSTRLHMYSNMHVLNHLSVWSSDCQATKLVLEYLIICNCCIFYLILNVFSRVNLHEQVINNTKTMTIGSSFGSLSVMLYSTIVALLKWYICSRLATFILK